MKYPVLVRDVAKLITASGYKIGQNELFAWLRFYGYVDTYNNANKICLDKGWMVLQPYTIQRYSSVETKFTTKITELGAKHLVSVFTRNNNIIK